MSGFTISIITPEGTAYENVVESAVVPGVEGELGILAHHVPLVAAVKLGILRLKRGPELFYFVVGEGFLEVTDAETVLLADSAVQASGLEEARKIKRHLEYGLDEGKPLSASDVHKGAAKILEHGD